MQIDFFSVGCNTPYKITKPIRLIELFAGIGSQSKALERLQANFEHYRICEFDKYAVQSYNAIHGTNFNPTDITKITADDLGITETDKYEYIMTYSFPCTDLSVAGKQAGMAKGSGTRSGLLWEVERLLTECKELPQVLLMENVPQVLNGDFGGWLDFLDGLGYRNYYKCLNAKNYGIPQNRDRCFMVSVLGDYYYDFPKPVTLQLRLKDMLESKVDEKYYLSEKIIKGFELHKSRHQEKGNGFGWKPQDGNNIAFAVQTRAGGRPDDNFIKEPQLQQVADLNHYKNDQMNRVYSGEGIAPTVETMSGGGREPKVVERIITVDETIKRCVKVNYEREKTQIATSDKEIYQCQCESGFQDNKVGIKLSPTLRAGNSHTAVYNNYRIRKLTPLECYRLMGFDDADFYKAKAAGVSDSQLYKQAGNSIVVNVLEALFKQLF